MSRIQGFFNDCMSCFYCKCNSKSYEQNFIYFFFLSDMCLSLNADAIKIWWRSRSWPDPGIIIIIITYITSARKVMFTHVTSVPENGGFNVILQEWLFLLHQWPYSSGGGMRPLSASRSPYSLGFSWWTIKQLNYEVNYLYVRC